MLDEQLFRPTNGAGWRLEIRRYHDTEHLDPGRAPIVMVPGYGMNSFILNFHPTGVSMVEHLCLEGFEVWTANLRGQGGSELITGTQQYGFRELALTDVPLALDLAREETKTDSDTLHAIGCSLGASVFYAYLAHNAKSHGLASLVAIGGPLRWDDVHPLLRAAFSSTTLAGMLPIKGTRMAARALLPVLEKVPQLLSIYMNASQIDLSQADELVKTVDDPNPYLNRQIANWIQKRDLVVAGRNVTEAIGAVEDLPILCLLANKDGIVPEAAALSITRAYDPDLVDTMTVGGDEGDWYAHADLFIAETARERVFEPLADWISAAGHHT
jgi:alpha-beta hydrolase superfamily lysophospholipase